MCLPRHVSKMAGHYINSNSNPGHLEVSQRYNAVLVALTHITEQNSYVDIIALQFTAKPDEVWLSRSLSRCHLSKVAFGTCRLGVFSTARTKAFTASSIKITSEFLSGHFVRVVN